MSIIQSSNFQEQSQQPLDNKIIAADSTARDSYPEVTRYWGMIVTLQSDGTSWILKSSSMGGGASDDITDNANWIAYANGGGGGSGIPVIPQPQIAVVLGNSGEGAGSAAHSTGQTIEDQTIIDNPFSVAVFWRPTDPAFLACNPKLFLMRFKRTSKSRTRTYKRKSFVHPVHMNGVDYPHSIWFGGITELPDRITEWSLVGTPFTRQLVEIDPKQWHGISPDFATSVFPIKIQDYEQDLGNSMIPPRNKYGGAAMNKAIIFKFAIVIENPDPASQVQYPYLMSELSDESLKIFPKVGTFADGSYFYGWTARLGSPNKSY